MDEHKHIVKQFNSLIERKKPQLRARLLHGIIFLFISTTLWLLMKLGHEYTTAITYPVEITTPPEGFMLVDDGTKRVQLRVKAQGFTLLRYKMGGDATPIRLSVGDYHASGPNARFGYYMTLRGQIPAFRAQLNSELELVGLTTDTLRFHMARVVAKRVPIRLELDLTQAGQIMQSGPVLLNPDSVSITGPAALLDTITHIHTARLAISASTPQNVTHTLRLLGPEQISLSPQNVEVSVPLDRFTEIALSIPIIPVNVPSDVDLTLLPENVELICNVPVGQYFNTQPEQFRVECDYVERGTVANGKMRLKLTEQPQHVSRVMFSPQFVDYFVKKCTAKGQGKP